MAVLQHLCTRSEVEDLLDHAVAPADARRGERVIQGEVTLNADGVEKTYKMGESFTELPGQTLQAFNRGSTDLVVVATYLLPDGPQLTTNL